MKTNIFLLLGMYDHKYPTARESHKAFNHILYSEFNQIDWINVFCQTQYATVVINNFSWNWQKQQNAANTILIAVLE